MAYENQLYSPIGGEQATIPDQHSTFDPQAFMLGVVGHVHTTRANLRAARPGEDIGPDIHHIYKQAGVVLRAYGISQTAQRILEQSAAREFRQVAPNSI